MARIKVEGRGERGKWTDALRDEIKVPYYFARQGRRAGTAKYTATWRQELVLLWRLGGKVNWRDTADAHQLQDPSVGLAVLSVACCCVI
ncbi:uncharacterized protein SPSK_10824 [Sporothrix schenckii 1099-18]|uniref:Uncharacterized protein n=1 Tax=Sporothrix schenckii 1099-18 TaxID=1397361 RepID=A0A0F2MDP6_SPOSC|nr:uncharacterized protein SPSK_10824 [Sporothrix schenckii 1099-18]KJR87813.1 hypothetical protein SPSK_10824 [Sporothrix schenckii 1099-18]